MTDGFEYDESSNENRFIILSDLKQEVPTGHLRVVKGEMRKTANNKEYPVLLMEDNDGSSYQVAAWKRDVKRCVAQWGGKIENWGTVHIALAQTGTRYELIPDDVVVVEEQLQE